MSYILKARIPKLRKFGMNNLNVRLLLLAYSVCTNKRFTDQVLATTMVYFTFKIKSRTRYMLGLGLHTC